MSRRREHADPFLGLRAKRLMTWPSGHVIKRQTTAINADNPRRGSDLETGVDHLVPGLLVQPPRPYTQRANAGDYDTGNQRKDQRVLDCCRSPCPLRS